MEHGNAQHKKKNKKSCLTSAMFSGKHSLLITRLLSGKSAGSRNTATWKGLKQTLKRGNKTRLRVVSMQEFVLPTPVTLLYCQGVKRDVRKKEGPVPFSHCYIIPAWLNYHQSAHMEERCSMKGLRRPEALVPRPIWLDEGTHCQRRVQIQNV